MRIGVMMLLMIIWGNLLIKGELDKNKVSFLNKMSNSQNNVINLRLRYVVKLNVC